MKHLIVGAALSGALLAGLIACTANNPVIATDLAAVVADIQTDATSKTLTAAELTILNTDVGKLQADETPDTQASTITGDVQSALTDLAPFLPDIAAILAVASSPNTPPMTPMAAKMQSDLANLKADLKG